MIFCWQQELIFANYLSQLRGAVAQLGERLNGIQEVVGSIPSSSTNDSNGLEGFPSKPFFVEYTKEYTNEIGRMGSRIWDGRIRYGFINPFFEFLLVYANDLKIFWDAPIQ